MEIIAMSKPAPLTLFTSTLETPTGIVRLATDDLGRLRLLDWEDSAVRWRPLLERLYRTAGGVRFDETQGAAWPIRDRLAAYFAGDLAAIETTCGTYRPRRVASPTPEALILEVQMRMAALEKHVASQVGDGAVVVVDGPLRGSEHVPGAVGYIKTQHVRYLPDALETVVGRLAEDAGLVCRIRTDVWLTKKAYEAGHFPSVGAVLAKKTDDLGPIALDDNWKEPVVPASAPLWTDDYSSLVSVLELNQDRLKNTVKPGVKEARKETGQNASSSPK